MSQLLQNFPQDYKNFVMSRELHESSKKFNKNIEKYKYVLVFPFYQSNGSVQDSLLIGFSDEPTIYKCDSENQKAAFQAFTSHEIIKINNIKAVFTESMAFSTSLFEKIPQDKVLWSQLIDAPKIEDGSYDLLLESFLEFFGLNRNEYNQDYSESFDFEGHFCKDQNKPNELELRVVWHDVDSYDKFGTIITLIFWKSEFIGWVSTGGRYLDTNSASTVNIDAWKDLMQAIYESTKFQRSNRLAGVSVYDMNAVEVDDVVSVPGVSMRSYSEEKV